MIQTQRELLISSQGPKLCFVYCSTSFLPCSLFPSNGNLHEHELAGADTGSPLVYASPLEAVYHRQSRGKRKSKHYPLLTTLVGTLIFEIPCRRCTNMLVKLQFLFCSSVVRRFNSRRMPIMTAVPARNCLGLHRYAGSTERCWNNGVKSLTR